jgi:hypothetical protein
MNNIKIFCSWDLKFDMFHEKQIELYVDRIPNDKSPEGVERFTFLLEPPEIMQALQDIAIGGLYDGKIDYLLTHNQRLIDASDKAYLQEFATSWIRDYEFTEKQFEVSTLVGGKMMAGGHVLRQDVFKRQDEILVPKKIWVSKNYPPKVTVDPNKNPTLPDGKEPLFDSQFHICIENSKRGNWFTEKLMDCLQTKTVPIYWGCPNIGDWFDERGMIIVDNEDEVINACNSIHPQLYKQMLPFVEKNYEKSKQYLDLGENLKNNISKILK